MRMTARIIYIQFSRIVIKQYCITSSVEAMTTEIALEPGIVKSNPELHENMSDKESTNTLLTAASSSNQMATEEDPLAHPEAINIVQQSDTTFVEDEETNNLSTFSIHHPLPCRNLCGAFDKMTEKIEEQLLLSHDEDDIRSPNGIEQFQSKDQYQYNIDLPKFDLHHDLRLDLSQSVIDRCSMYSVIHGINREVQDMAAHDQNCHVDTTGEEESPLVEAVNGKPKPSQKKTGPGLELAVLDEEKFLLAVIASRNQEEMMIRDCPKTFSEAIGESDGTVVTDEGTSQTDNALSVVSASRTQLWKPSRSWWEAKSGKNPWIEPALHNKRWRYLWPLIYYHKFLAKCVKKLKRNQVDVKTSLNPVSAFLREEVCAVSDHLASVSRFDSDTWMNALPHFQGWTHAEMDEEQEPLLRLIIKQLPLKNIKKSKECVDGPNYRKVIDESFSKAMVKAKEQLKSGGGEYQVGEKKYISSGPNQSQRRLVGVARPTGRRPPRAGRGGNKPPRSNTNKNYSRHHRNQYHPPSEVNMSMSSMHSMYGYDPSFHQLNQSMGYMPPPPEFYGHPHMPHYGYHDHSMLDQSGYFPPGQWGIPPQPYNMNHNPGQEISVDGASNHGEDNMSQCSDVNPVAPVVSLSFLDPNTSRIGDPKTPSKSYRGQQQNPSSPYWNHLVNGVPGLGSPPGAANSPQHYMHYGKPQFMNPQGHGGMMPPSPATAFGASGYFTHRIGKSNSYQSNQDSHSQTESISISSPDVDEKENSVE